MFVFKPGCIAGTKSLRAVNQVGAGAQVILMAILEPLKQAGALNAEPGDCDLSEDLIMSPNSSATRRQFQ